MADVEVNVEERQEESAPESSRDDIGTEPAAETLIDSAIVSGVAAVRADERANDAAISEVAAEINAVRAESAAETVHAENESLQEIANKLLETSRNLAAIQAGQVAEEITELPEPSIDPQVDIEPGNEHWLTKKWSMGGLFGKSKTKVDD